MARPGPAVAAVSSACGRGNAVGLTFVIDRGQFFRYLLEFVFFFVVEKESEKEESKYYLNIIQSEYYYCESIKSIIQTTRLTY